MKRNPVPYPVRHVLSVLADMGLLEANRGFSLKQWALRLKPEKAEPGRLEVYFEGGPRVRVDLLAGDGPYGVAIGLMSVSIWSIWMSRQEADAFLASVSAHLERGRALLVDEMSQELPTHRAEFVWTNGGSAAHMGVVGRSRLVLDEEAIRLLLCTR